jgi:hypothetical protein
MRIEKLTSEEPNQLNDYQLAASYTETFMGDEVLFPLLLDLRGHDGQVAYSLHLTPENVGAILDAILA